MKKNMSFFWTVLSAVLITAAAGCGGQALPDGMPPLQPTTLTFTVGGKPLTEAQISLSSVDASLNRWSAGGNTDEAGSITLKTLGQYDGVPEGEWVVCVTKVQIIPGPTAATPKPSTQAEYMKWLKKCNEEEKKIREVGTDYNNPATSPLKINIVKGKNSIKMDDIPLDGTEL